MNSIKLATKKILETLGLRCTKVHLTRDIPYVNENGCHGLVRMFKDMYGREMSFHISFMEDPTPFPCGGTWTVFKDDDTATFELFTKTVKQFDLLHKPIIGTRIDAKNIKNPFFGCKSAEEVLVACDLAMMAQQSHVE